MKLTSLKYVVINNLLVQLKARHTIAVNKTQAVLQTKELEVKLPNMEIITSYLLLSTGLLWHKSLWAN